MIDGNKISTTSAEIGGKDSAYESRKPEEQQINKESHRNDSLTNCLMEQICKPANLNQAYKRVKANKGSPGVDGITVNELKDLIEQHKDKLIQ